MNTIAQLVQLVRDGDLDGARRVAADMECPGPSIGSPRDVYAIMRETALAEQEEVWLLYATRRNALKKKERVFLGGASASIVDVAVVLRKVLLSGASAFVVVHNHPSGVADPSPEDIANYNAQTGIEIAKLVLHEAHDWDKAVVTVADYVDGYLPEEIGSEILGRVGIAVAAATMLPESKKNSR